MRFHCELNRKFMEPISFRYNTVNRKAFIKSNPIHSRETRHVVYKFFFFGSDKDEEGKFIYDLRSSLIFFC